MRKIFLIIMVSILAPTFLSCEKDEPEEDIILDSKPIGREEEKQALMLDHAQDCETGIFMA